jgi:hypothetical protein
MEEEKENTKFRPLFTERVPSLQTLLYRPPFVPNYPIFLYRFQNRYQKIIMLQNIFLFIQNLITPDDTIFI